MPTTQTYPRRRTNVRLTISAIDRTDVLISKSLRIRQVLNNQADTCSFSVVQPASWRPSSHLSVKPTVGQTVTVEYRVGTGSWITIFAGTVSRISEPRLAYKRVRWDVKCVDYTALLRQRLVLEIYSIETWTVGDIVRDLLMHYAPTVSDAAVDDLPVPVAMAFNYQYVSDCLQTLAGVIDGDWYVDYNRVLHFFQASDSGTPSTLSITDSSNNFSELLIEPQLDQVRNRVYVQGGESLSDGITEVFIANGTRDAWQLEEKNVVNATMHINGAEGNLGIEGVDDEALVDFLLIRNDGKVRHAVQADTVPAQARVSIQYQCRYPISVVVEDLDSQRMVAQLSDRQYGDYVNSLSPTAFWRMSDSSTTMVDETGAHNGTYGSGGFAPTLGQPGFLTGEPNETTVLFDGVADFAQVVNHVDLQIGSTGGSWWLNLWMRRPGPTTYNPSGSYILFKGGKYAVRLDYPWEGAVMLWSGDYTSGTSAIRLDADNLNTTLITIADTDWHMVTFSYDATTGYLVTSLDGRRTRRGQSTLTLGADTSALFFGSVGGLTPAMVQLGQIALLKGAPLTEAQTLAVYQAGVESGVREARITKSDSNSLAESRAAGELELARWSEIITAVSWASPVPGWTIGTLVPITLTQNGSGRTYSGSAKIQTIDISALGGQELTWRVSAQENRFDTIDFWRRIVREGQKVGGPVGAALTKVDIVRDDGWILIDSFTLT